MNNIENTLAEAIENDRPRVVVRRHRVDWDDPSFETAQRAAAILSSDNSPRCVYVNPLITVTCAMPTADFLHEIRKRQAEWCRNASRTLRSRTRRKASDWMGAGVKSFNSKWSRYLDRCLCFTGILFVNGQIIHPDKWESLVASNPVDGQANGAPPSSPGYSECPHSVNKGDS